MRNPSESQNVENKEQAPAVYELRVNRWIDRGKEYEKWQAEKEAWRNAHPEDEEPDDLEFEEEDNLVSRETVDLEKLPARVREIYKNIKEADPLSTDDIVIYRGNKFICLIGGRGVSKVGDRSTFDKSDLEALKKLEELGPELAAEAERLMDEELRSGK